MERARQIIDRITGERRARGAERTERGAAYASERIYEDEPLLKTGRQLAWEMAARRAPFRSAGRAQGGAVSQRGRASAGERTGAGADACITSGASSGLAAGAMRTPAAAVCLGAAPALATKGPFGASARDYSLFDLGEFPAASTCELPETLRELRALERHASERGWSAARLFSQQSRLAADYEDDFAYDGVFSHYFPTYRMMSDSQLRGYFAWRTQVRRGLIEKTSLSFAFVYLYELLNGIGYSDPEEGHELLCRFSAAYRAHDARIMRYARVWVDDFVVYHGLGRARLGALLAEGAQASGGALEADAPRGEGASEGMRLRDGKVAALGVAARGHRVGELAWDEAFLLLAEEEGEAVSSCAGLASAGLPPAPRAAVVRETRASAAHAGQGAAGSGARAGVRTRAPLSDERLAAALSTLASPGLARSRVYREHPSEIGALVAGTWRALSAYYRANRATSLFAHLFGTRAESSYQMFRSAVFWEGAPHADAVYEASALTRFACRGGRWRREGISCEGMRSAELGRILKAVQRRGAERLGFECALKDPDVPKYLMRIIDRQVDGLCARREAQRAEEEAREARRVEIDFSKLAGIRQAASATREALLVEEEREGAEGEAPHAVAPRAAAPQDAARHAAVSPPAVPPVAMPHAVSPRAESPGDSPGSFGLGSADQPARAAGLVPHEAAYLVCLLAGAPAAERAAALAQAGALESLVIDAINEKLFDVLGDVAIEEGEGGPRLVEDYVEDVKGCIGYDG